MFDVQTPSPPYRTSKICCHNWVVSISCHKLWANQNKRPFVTFHDAPWLGWTTEIFSHCYCKKDPKLSVSLYCAIYIYRVHSILKTLEFQEFNFKALKVLEIGIWSLKDLDFWSEQDHKISSFRVVSTNVHANSVQTSCNASELLFSFIL